MEEAVIIAAVRTGSRRSASTSSPRDSSIRRYRPRCLATTPASIVTNYDTRCQSGAWSAPPTSPRWPSTS